MVARIITMPVAGSTVFSIMLTAPPDRRVSPGTIASTVAVSACSAWRTSGSVFCGTEKLT